MDDNLHSSGATSLTRSRRKHNLTTEIGTKYLNIEYKESHWSIIEEMLLEEVANSLSSKNKLDISTIFTLYNHIAESELGKKAFIGRKSLNGLRLKIHHIVNYSNTCQSRLIEQIHSCV